MNTRFRSPILLLLFTFFGLSAAFPAAQRASPEAVAKAFYNGYIRSTAKGVDPFGKKSTLKKHLTKRLIKAEVEAYESSQEADYFLRSKEYNGDWENNFTASKASVKGQAATIIVTFPGNYPRLKVMLRQEAGAWKIDKVQNLPAK
jgi:hypothetical protein